MKGILAHLQEPRWNSYTPGSATWTLLPSGHQSGGEGAALLGGFHSPITTSRGQSRKRKGVRYSCCIHGSSIWLTPVFLHQQTCSEPSIHEIPGPTRCGLIQPKAYYRLGGRLTPVPPSKLKPMLASQNDKPSFSDGVWIHISLRSWVSSEVMFDISRQFIPYTFKMLRERCLKYHDETSNPSVA